MDTDEPLCRAQTGERLRLVRGGFLDSNGIFFPSSTQCDMAPGSGWVLYYDEEPNRSMAPRRIIMEPGPQPSAAEPAEDAAPAPAPVSTEHHAAAPEHHAAEHAPVSLQPSEGDADFSGVLGVGQMLQDNPWAPLVVIILAVVAVLGGRQGWKFYSERSAQKHELEMKKLELQAQVQGLGGAQPPPCQARDVDQDQRISKLGDRVDEDEKRIAALERRLATFSGPDSDVVEDLEKRIKKAERAIATLKREEN